MKPPPPMFPACGWTTASAKPTATAASTALPPLFRISTPAAEANPLTLTTMAWRAWIGLEAAAAIAGETATMADNNSEISSLRLNVMRKCAAVGEGRGYLGTFPEPAQALEASLVR